jgi:hypothetical protein
MRREVRAVLVALCSVIACDDADKEAADSSSDTANAADGGVKDARDGGAQSEQGEGGEGAPNRLGFFVTSDSSATGDLGGLPGADARCQRLAAAAGAGGRTWRAYLSAESSAAGGPVHARDRIGQGPWYNAKGDLVAQDLSALHARTGDAAIFLDENGEKINGQWEGSPAPNQHDILTGSDAEGRVLAGFTCADWTSAEATLFARVGHSDGLGPMRNGAPPYDSWQSSHESAGCNDTAPRGGAGKIYCFAAD